MNEDKPLGKSDEPLFMAMRKDDPDLVRCTEQAQDSLSLFCGLYDQYKTNLGVFFAIKVPVVDGEDVAHLWYSFTGHKNGVMSGKHFEIPPQLAAHESLSVPSEQVEDWMINDHGVLYGGFSLRYQRSLMPEDKRADYDEHIGVNKYADI